MIGHTVLACAIRDYFWAHAMGRRGAAGSILESDSALIQHVLQLPALQLQLDVRYACVVLAAVLVLQAHSRPSKLKKKSNRE